MPQLLIDATILFDMMVSIFTYKFKDARNDTKVTILLFSPSKAEARGEAKLQILNEHPN